MWGPPVLHSGETRTLSPTHAQKSNKILATSCVYTTQHLPINTGLKYLDRSNPANAYRSRFIYFLKELIKIKRHFQPLNQMMNSTTCYQSSIQGHTGVCEAHPWCGCGCVGEPPPLFFLFKITVVEITTDNYQINS